MSRRTDHDLDDLTEALSSHLQRGEHGRRRCRVLGRGVVREVRVSR